MYNNVNLNISIVCLFLWTFISCFFFILKNLNAQNNFLILHKVNHMTFISNNSIYANKHSHSYSHTWPQAITSRWSWFVHTSLDVWMFSIRSSHSLPSFSSKVFYKVIIIRIINRDEDRDDDNYKTLTTKPSNCNFSRTVELI